MSRHARSAVLGLWLAHAAAAAPASVAFLGLEAPVPPDWQAEPPASSMRLAQFRLPAPGGGEPARMVVFYFGAGQGGSPQANIDRWTSQFSSPDGSPVRPRISTFETHGMPVTRVELEGTYARGVGMGPVGTPLPGRRLVAAVVDTPRGRIFAQLHGPADVVASHRTGFDAFIAGLAPASAP